MPLFDYRAAARGGQVTVGRLEGESVQQIAGILREKGLYPVSIKPHVESMQIDISGRSKEGKVPLKVLTLFCRQFSVMINAGLPLMPCISILLQQCEHARFRTILADVRKSLESGESLSRSMARHPKTFPPLMVNMIEAGETGGVLDKVFERIAEHYEKESALVAKVKSAMVYPIIVIIVAIGVTAGLIMFVLPMFAEMFSGSGVVLPWITRFLLGIGFVLRRYILYILLGLALIITPIVLYIRTPQGRMIKDATILRLPLFGTLTLKMLSSRFTRTFSTLMSSGVPILQCLEVVGRVVDNAVAGEKIRQVIELVRTGIPLGQSLENVGLYPPMVVQMAAIGEETGALDTLLTKVADFYDDEVDIAVKGLTAAIEPIITLFLAGVVGLILLSVFLPMSQMLQVVG